MAAVLSALVLAGGYVAIRAMPGLMQSFQVFGGEGGGRAIPANSSDRPSSKPISKPSAEPLREEIVPSTKSLAVLPPSHYVFSPEPTRQTVPALAGGSILAAPPHSSKPKRAPLRPRQVVLSDGTVVQMPSAPQQPSPKAQQVRLPEIMYSSKSAPITIYNGSR